VKELDLLFLLGVCAAVIDLDVSWSMAKDYTFLGEVKEDGPVQALNAILDEQGDLHMAVLEELTELLPHDHVIVGAECLCQRFKHACGLTDQLLRG
jgi:hypothetical protein